jgi:hypothetical protein
MTGIIRPTSPRNEVFFEGMMIAFALTTVVGFAQADIREFRPRVLSLCRSGKSQP